VPETADRMMAIRAQEARSAEMPLAVIIEEDDTAAEVANSLLRLLGFQVIRVTQGGEALHLIAQGPIDLILLEANLPDMDGAAFIEVAQRLPGFRDIKLIAASAVHTQGPQLGQKIMKLGVQHYLDKPYSVARMRHKLREMFPMAQQGAHRLSAREVEALAKPAAVVVNGQKRPVRLIAASPTRFVLKGQQLPSGQVLEVRLKHREEQWGELVTIDLVALALVVRSSVIGGAPMSDCELQMARPPLEWDRMTEELPNP